MNIKEVFTKRQNGEITFKGLMEKTIEKLEQDKELHAFLYLKDPSELIREAEEADKAWENGVRRPLQGIPVAVKDNICVSGMPCTCASKVLQDFVAPYDATVVKKLKKSGAIIVGKTNLDEFAMGSSSENSAFGPTKNPLDLSRSPGGSSGGSAAAVAADMCMVALGLQWQGLIWNRSLQVKAQGLSA